MPVPNKVFDETPESIPFKLMELFIKHPNDTFSFTELKKQFDDIVIAYLIFLVYERKIEQFSKNNDLWYRLKK